MLFDVLKRRPRAALPFENDTATVKCITKGYQDFTQIIVPPNIWGVFHEPRLDFNRRKEPNWL
jgi:hypothetical protein